MFTTACKGLATTIGRSEKHGKTWERWNGGPGREAKLNS
jgi:hypothetical protein